MMDKFQGFEHVQHLVGLLLHKLIHQYGVVMEAISLWHHGDAMEAEVPLNVALSSLSGLVSYMLLFSP